MDEVIMKEVNVKREVKNDLYSGISDALQMAKSISKETPKKEQHHESSNVTNESKVMDLNDASNDFLDDLLK